MLRHSGPSELTAALDQLLETLACYGEPVERLLPGLPLHEIEQIVSVLPYRVPQEVYELYQWRNGRQVQSLTYREQRQNRESVYIIPFYEMMTLQECVNHVAAIVRHDQRVLETFYEPSGVWYHSPPLHHFPFLNLHESFFCVHGSFEGSETGTVFDHYVDDPPVTIAHNLLGFFRAITECWETGIYAKNPNARVDNAPFDDFLIDEESQRHVFHKHRMR